LDNFTLSYRGNVETEVEDASAARPIILKATPLKVDLRNVSSELSKPIALNVDATLKPYGGFKIDGTVGIDPLAAQLHGLDQSLPPAEMKKLLAENMKVTDDDLKKQAIARVLAVGYYLDQQVDPVRLAVANRDHRSLGARSSRISAQIN
jgi:hypothetical protein